MSLNFNGTGQGTVTQYLHQLLRRNEACCYKFINTHSLQVHCLSQCLNSIQVDGLVRNTVDVLEAKLRHTALKWHLTTFKTNLLLIS